MHKIFLRKRRIIPPPTYYRNTVKLSTLPSPPPLPPLALLAPFPYLLNKLFARLWHALIQIKKMHGPVSEFFFEPMSM